MSTGEEDMSSVIAELQATEDSAERSATASLIKPTTQLFLSPRKGINLTGFSVVIDCCPEALSPEALKAAAVKHYLHLSCQTGKLGSRDLRVKLPQLYTFFTSLPSSEPPKVLVVCPTGKDLSVGTALAVLCLFTTEAGEINAGPLQTPNTIDKSFIKHRLSWITTSNPALNPSRATLQSVNAVLFDTPAPSATPNPQFEANLPIRETRTVSREPSPVTSATSDTNEPNGNNDNATPPSTPPSLPSRIFTALHSSTWTFTRTLHSALPTHPSGTVKGTASFTLCAQSASALPTLLYAEEGEFATNNGLRFNARRKYVYQLVNGEEQEEEKGKDADFIRVRFFDDEKFPRAKVEDGVGEKGQGIGGLFVEMGALEEWRAYGEDVVKAKNRETHLCAEDLYTASWMLGRGMLEGDEGRWWEVRYDVKGPKKDYVSETRYERA